jgi:hypothetical protein
VRTRRYISRIPPSTAITATFRFDCLASANNNNNNACESPESRNCVADETPDVTRILFRILGGVFLVCAPEGHFHLRVFTTRNRRALKPVLRAPSDAWRKFAPQRTRDGADAASSNPLEHPWRRVIEIQSTSFYRPVSQEADIFAPPGKKAALHLRARVRYVRLRNRAERGRGGTGFTRINSLDAAWPGAPLNPS